MTNNTEERIYYPPGGILIWMILSVEFLTFIPALVAFFAYYHDAPSEFAASAAHLDLTIGTINTCVLILGGWFVAQGLAALRENRSELSQRLFALGGLSGLLFLGLKGFEYGQKYSAGFDLAYNDFFTMYWLITGFHFLHVLVGTVLLGYTVRSISRGRYSSAEHDDVETIGVFWHMCDLIWILVFPALYILPLGGAQ